MLKISFGYCVEEEVGKVERRSGRVMVGETFILLRKQEGNEGLPQRLPRNTSRFSMEYGSSRLGASELVPWSCSRWDTYYSGRSPLSRGGRGWCSRSIASCGGAALASGSWGALRGAFLALLPRDSTRSWAGHWLGIKVLGSLGVSWSED